MSKAIVFGATESVEYLYSKIEKEYEIICLCDNDKNKWGKSIHEKNIISPKQIEAFNYDAIIIISLSALYKIQNQLVSMGIPKEKIITRYVEYKVQGRYVFLNNFAKLYYSTRKGCDNVAVAEAGVFQGEFAARINEAFLDKKIYLFDTFEGFDKRDIVYETENNFSDAKESHLNITSEEMVMSKMKYPENVIIRKGYFPDSAGEITDSFVFVNLDMDLYKPTLEGLRFFYPKLIRGGVILIHDFFSDGYFGVNEAVSEFLAECAEAGDKCFPIGDDVSLAIYR